MERIDCDVCIIGAGSGGLSVAAGCAQLGADVVLIEGHKMGGDCLNYGCIPSKALIASARRAHAMSHTGDLGIAAVEPQVDYAAAKDHVHRVIATIAPVDSQERFEGMGVRVIRDWARFAGPDKVVAGAHEIRARRYVIATGSGPFVPPIDGLDDVDYLTNETLFDLRETPAHLIVVGGGPIGCEMAQAHARLGCKVTLIEGEKVLGKDDPDFAAQVIEAMRRDGVEIVEGAQAKRVDAKDGGIAVQTDRGTHTGSHLLMAVGRKVNLSRLDLDAGGIDHDRAVTVGDDLRSVSNRKVYAVGDAAGRMQFTHVAGYHAGVVVRAIMFGLPAKARQDHIPWVTYTSPELAQVGPTEAEARKRHGTDLEVVEVGYDDVDRAQTEGETEGRLKVMVADGKPVGATIVGPHAGELLATWAQMIANGTKMKALADTVLPYPTLAEINKKAASQYFSPRLFGNDMVRRVVGFVQRYVP